jgi:hypothetical protein
MKLLFYSALASCTIVTSAFCQNAVDKATLSPVDAVKTFASDMIDGRATSMWDAMPADYQTDVVTMIQDFGKKADADVYNEFMLTLGKANSLLKDKQAIIIEMMEDKILEEKPEKAERFEKMKANYTQVTGLFDVVLNSDLKSADGLKTIDMVAFCKAIEPSMKALMKNVQAVEKDCNIENLSVKLVSQEGDKAVVEVDCAKREAKEVSLVRTGNRWVPAKMVEEWDGKMEMAKFGMAGLGQVDPGKKMQAMMMMKMAQGIIAELNKAETAVEMKETMKNQFGKFMPKGMKAL